MQGQQGTSGSRQQVSGLSLPRNSLLQSRGNRVTTTGQIDSPVAVDDANGGGPVNNGCEELPEFHQQVRCSVSMHHRIGSLYKTQSTVCARRDACFNPIDSLRPSMCSDSDHISPVCFVNPMNDTA